jgi:hypothetical protein
MIAGIDPRIRTFATVHSHNQDTRIKEYKHRAYMLKMLNMKQEPRYRQGRKDLSSWYQSTKPQRRVQTVELDYNLIGF